MIDVLALWAAAGIPTLIYEVLWLHRQGSSLREACSRTRREAILSGLPLWFADLLGRRRYVSLIAIGLWPLFVGVRIRGAFR